MYIEDFRCTSDLANLASEKASTIVTAVKSIFFAPNAEWSMCTDETLA